MFSTRSINCRRWIEASETPSRKIWLEAGLSGAIADAAVLGKQNRGPSPARHICADNHGHYHNRHTKEHSHNSPDRAPERKRENNRKRAHIKRFAHGHGLHKVANDP